MLISLRTLINTTLFWFIILIWFWLYTKYDPTPAKYLLYAIWREKLWNIEVTTPWSSINTWTVEYLSNQLIAERLNNLEQLCSRSVRLPIYDDAIVNNPTTNSIPSNVTTVSTWIIQNNTIPVIDNSNLLRNNSNL